jgi:ABC-type Fe3+-hydroxamate transport system substrate-binding protein
MPESDPEDLGPPRRIVSLVPSTTESVCVLGRADRLVGCTRWCTEPAAALRGVARIGGTKNPDREAIAALAPDLVLANGEENRAEDLAWLEQRFPVLVQTPGDVPEAVRDLRALAVRLGATAAAAPLLRQIEARIAALAAAPPPRPQRVYYAIWRRPWMSVGRTTFVHDVLTRIGFANVCADATARYPAVEPSQAVERGVECVLLASEPWAFDEAQRAEIAALRLFGGARLVLCDGRDFCWHGVRMADGLARAAAVARRLG